MFVIFTLFILLYATSNETGLYLYMSTYIKLFRDIFISKGFIYYTHCYKYAWYIGICYMNTLLLHNKIL